MQLLESQLHLMEHRLEIRALRALPIRSLALARVTPASLETSRERNVLYWQRFGLDVACTDRLGKDSVQYWGMVRQRSVVAPPPVVAEVLKAKEVTFESA